MSRLDQRALALSHHAADCERWGLCADAGEARTMARALRIDALAESARAAALFERLLRP